MNVPARAYTVHQQEERRWECLAVIRRVIALEKTLMPAELLKSWSLEMIRDEYGDACIKELMKHL